MWRTGALPLLLLLLVLGVDAVDVEMPTPSLLWELTLMQRGPLHHDKAEPFQRKVVLVKGVGPSAQISIWALQPFSPSDTDNRWNAYHDIISRYVSKTGISQ